MAEKELAKIGDQAKKRWPLEGPYHYSSLRRALSRGQYRPRHHHIPSP